MSCARKWEIRPHPLRRPDEGVDDLATLRHQESRPYYLDATAVDGDAGMRIVAWRDDFGVDDDCIDQDRSFSYFVPRSVFIFCEDPLGLEGPTRKRPGRDHRDWNAHPRHRLHLRFGLFP